MLTLITGKPGSFKTAKTATLAIQYLKEGRQVYTNIDEFDYEVGDKVLKSLANTLKATIRDSDLVVKISNDEFLVILLNIINESNAIIISEKLIDNFSKEKIIVNNETKQALMKTICSGISIYPDNATSIEEIIKKTEASVRVQEPIKVISSEN